MLPYEFKGVLTECFPEVAGRFAHKFYVRYIHLDRARVLEYEANLGRGSCLCVGTSKDEDQTDVRRWHLFLYNH